MAKKLEVFQRPLSLQQNKAVVVTNVGTGLHNYVRRRDGRMRDRTSSMKYDTFHTPTDGFTNLQPLDGTRFANDAIGLRDAITEFFCDPQGSVEWQRRHVFRNVLQCP